jgi:adenine deaminase
LSESSGSVAVGKRADIVLLDANPFSDISHTQRIRAIVVAGRLLQRADLEALLGGCGRSSPEPADYQGSRRYWR